MKFPVDYYFQQDNYNNVRIISYNFNFYKTSLREVLNLYASVCIH